MANFSELKTLIDAYVNRNGVQAITGTVLNGVLNTMVDQLGRGYELVGIAHPLDNPGQPDGPVAYVASETGTYVFFGGYTVNPGEIAMLYYDTGWAKVTLYEGIQEVSAVVDGSEGTPAVTVTYEEGVMFFSFSGLKGPQGVQGIQGGPGITAATVSVDNTSGNPTAEVSISGTTLNLSFKGLKGPQGNTGVSADYPITIVNNLTTSDPASALSAEMGVQLESEITAVGIKTDLMYPNVIDETNVDPTDQSLYNYQINSDNEYTTSTAYKHIRVPVIPGQKVQVKAAANNSCQMAWLRDDAAPVSGGTPHFVAGTTRFLLSAGSEDVYTVPDGAAMMYFYAGQSPYPYLPQVIKITSSKIFGLADSLSSDSTVDALSANNGKTLDLGYKEEPQEITATTKLQISDTSHNIVTNSGSTYVVYSVPVTMGDILHLTASDSSSHTIRCGFAYTVASGYHAWNYADLTSSSVDYTATAPFVGFFVVYHISTYFADMVITKRAYTTEGATVSGTKGLLDGIASMLGVKDYDKVIPFWMTGRFQYYNQNGDASSSSMARTGKVPTNGRKWLYFTQYVTTGDGTAGIRFFASDDSGVMGFRQVIKADAVGLRRVLLEVPDNSDYFIASCSQSKMGDWFAYLFDDDRLAQLIRTAEDSKHIKVCLLGNSYTADAWRYVPTMLLQYGITMESFFYYRGQGSLYDLDTQWTDTSPTGESDYDHQQHARITFYVNSENDPVWREWGSVLSAADIVGRRKWDIITLQQGGNRCKDLDSYYPSLQNVIDKIAAICDYPYALWWYMAYNGSSQNAQDGMNQQSLDTQKYIIKTFPFGNFIPTAAAVFNAQTNDTLAALGGSDYHHMYASDNVHMQEGLPCYVAACAVVQRLLDVFRPGMTVLQDQFRATAENIADLGMSQTANGSSTGVNDANCYLAQKAAIIAGRNPYEIIEI